MSQWPWQVGNDLGASEVSACGNYKIFHKIFHFEFSETNERRLDDNSFSVTALRTCTEFHNC